MATTAQGRRPRRGQASEDAQPPADTGPIECGPCRGSGTVESNAGGTPHTLTCPWCEGGKVRLPEHDAQEHVAERYVPREKTPEEKAAEAEAAKARKPAARKKPAAKKPAAAKKKPAAKKSAAAKKPAAKKPADA